MCGSLQYSEAKPGKDPQADKLQATWGGRGDNFPVVDNEGAHSAMFNGHAREETVKEKFLKQGWRRGELKVSGYTEQRKEYEVPLGHIICIVTRVIPNHGKVFNILMRPARGAEKEVHPRFPVLRRPRY